MQPTAATNTKITHQEQPAFPYPPSWVDRLTAWISRLPGPAWLYYFGAALILYLMYLSVKWWETGSPRATISQWSILIGLIGFYYLAAVYYLDIIARDAMERLRPAIDGPAYRVAELEYRLTTMPPKLVWLMTLLGTIGGVLTVLGIRVGALFYPGPAFASLPATVLEVAIIIFIDVGFFVGSYHTVHQLRIVSMIYTELTKVDLFNQAPLYAFARLAGYTAISWSIPQYFWLTSGLEQAAFGVLLGFFTVAVILGIITFTLPLLGIHRLLARAKEQLQGETNIRLQAILRLFEQELEKGDFAQMDAINKAIDNAERERRIVDSIPTWPWQPGSLRGAVTAFLLPLVLWLATRFLERLVEP